MYAELRQQLGGGELVELPQGGTLRLEARPASVLLPSGIHECFCSAANCAVACGANCFYEYALLQVVFCHVGALIFTLPRNLWSTQPSEPVANTELHKTR